MTEPLARVARLTPAGRSALATLVIDGPSAVAIARSLFQSRAGSSFDLRDPGPHYGWFGIDPKDDVVLTLVGSGESPAVEIHCHGGSAIVEGLIEQIVRAGAIRADWREILRRRGASEIHVEAVEALGQCGTERAALVLLDQVAGALDRAFVAIENSRSLAEVNELLAWAPFGRHLTAPWRVSLVGRPNVGKSLLLNAILGHERAIVSDIAGTTRDVIDGLVALDGWPVLFSDGAGVRDTDDPIETAGIESIRREAKEADLRVLVLDASTPIQQEDARLLDEIGPELVVANKVDLGACWSDDDLPGPIRWVSALTETGIDELLGEIARRLVPAAPPVGQAVPFTERQIRWLESRAGLYR